MSALKRCIQACYMCETGDGWKAALHFHGLDACRQVIAPNEPTAAKMLCLM